MAYAGTDYERALRWAGYLGIAAMIAAALFLQPKAIPAPLNSTVFGCYQASAAPPISLDASGLQIEQSGFPRIGFHLERHKTGVALTAEAPIKAVLDRGTYRYSFYRPGGGLYLNFFKVIEGRRYGVFDESELSRFMMLTEDGVYLPYEKTANGSCQAAGLKAVNPRTYPKAAGPVTTTSRNSRPTISIKVLHHDDGGLSPIPA